MAVDVRTRLDGPRTELDPAYLFDDELPARIAEHADAIVPALAFIRPRPLSVDVDGQAWTLTADDHRVSIKRGATLDATARVTLHREQLADRRVHDAHRNLRATSCRSTLRDGRGGRHVGGVDRGLRRQHHVGIDTEFVVDNARRDHE